MELFTVPYFSKWYITMYPGIQTRYVVTLDIIVFLMPIIQKILALKHLSNALTSPLVPYSQPLSHPTLSPARRIIVIPSVLAHNQYCPYQLILLSIYGVVFSNVEFIM